MKLGLLRRSRLTLFAAVALASLSLASIARADNVEDPLEPMNRGIFWFNDKVYTYLLRPISIGYDKITPTPVQNSVHNFFSNIRSPIYMVSDVVQLKFTQLGVHSARFVINSTLGVAGLFDVAKRFDLKEHPTDFGTALGYDGFEPGPYIVLPLLGPSNLRDTLGKVADTFLNPVYYVSTLDISDDAQTAIIVGTKTLETVDDVNRAREAIDLSKQGSVDHYLFIRSAYNQHRLNLIYDNHPPKPAGAPAQEDEPTLDSESAGVPIIGQ